jgi:hypothetical protein
MVKGRANYVVPNTRRQVFQSMDLSAVNGNPVVNGPAKTAGASAIKTESLQPSDGTIP